MDWFFRHSENKNISSFKTTITTTTTAHSKIYYVVCCAHCCILVLLLSAVCCGHLLVYQSVYRDYTPAVASCKKGGLLSVHLVVHIYIHFLSTKPTKPEPCARFRLTQTQSGFVETKSDIRLGLYIKQQHIYCILQWCLDMETKASVVLLLANRI